MTQNQEAMHRPGNMYSTMNNVAPGYLQNTIAHLIPDHRHNTRL